MYGHTRPLWPCMTMYGYTRSRTPTRFPLGAMHGHTWPWMSIHSHVWPHMAFKANTWPHMAIHGRAWPYIDMSEYTRPCMATHGHVWPCMAVCGHACPDMAIFSYRIDENPEIKISFRCVKLRKNKENQGFTFFGFLPAYLGVSDSLAYFKRRGLKRSIV